MSDLDKIKKRVEREREWHEERFSDDDLRSGTGRFYHALKNWYRDYDNYCLSSKCHRALEVGAGLETISIENEITFSLSSIDISTKAIAALKSKIISSNVTFEVADGHNLPYSDNEFDLIFARGVLHHLDLEAGISELKRVLSPKGKVVFGEPLAGNPLIQIYRLLTPKLRTPDERPLKSKDIKFVRNSFERISVKYYGFLTIFTAILTNRHSVLAERLDDFLLNRLKLGPFLAWACLIENISSNS